MSRLRCSQQRWGRGGSVARGTWGYGAMGSASQLPILLVTLEDVPKGLQGFWGKEVDAAVDDVADKGAGLLYVVQDLRGERAGVRRGGATATIPTDPLSLWVLPVATGVVLNGRAHLVTALQLHLQGKSKLHAFSLPAPSAPGTPVLRPPPTRVGTSVVCNGWFGTVSPTRLRIPERPGLCLPGSASLTPS